jgi:hypothetical protein
MSAISFLSLILLYISTAAAWTRTDHWQTKVITTFQGSLYTSSIAVYPTGSATPTSSNISTTIVSDHAPGGWLVSYHSYPITVTDLFYPAGADVCTSTGFKECSPTPTYTLSGSITTNYYAPLIISQPASCTQTSFLYTTPQSVFPPALYRTIPNAVNQATESGEALFITTYVTTLSTNLGGQAVTGSVMDVYLSADKVLGVLPGYEAYPLSQCVDPRVYSCSASTADFTVEPVTATCETTGQVYPPTAAAAAGGGGGGDGSRSDGSGPANPTKTGGAGGLVSFVPRTWALLSFSGIVVLFVLLY